MVKAWTAVAGVGVALGAAYAGGTWWAGREVQQALQAQQARMGQEVPFVKVAEQRYERGWWSSMRTTTYEFGCLPAGDEGQPPRPLRLTVLDRIQHGPLAGGRHLGAAYMESELVLSGQVQEAASRFFGSAPPLRVQTVVGFDGGYHSRVTSPAGQIQGEQGEQLTWQGLQGEVSANGAGTELRYEVRMPGLELRAPAAQGTMKMTGLQVRGDGHRPAEGSWWLMTGRGEGEIASVEFEGMAPGGASMKAGFSQLRFASDTRIEQDLLHSTSTITGQGRIGDTPLDKLEMQASIKRLHAPTYAKLVSTLMQGGAGCGEEGPDPAQLLASLEGDLRQLLPHGPEYALDKLAVEYGGQRGELSYAIAVEGVTAEELELPVPALLMTKGQLRADVKLPVTWLQELAAQPALRKAGSAPDPQMLNLMLDQFAAQGLLVRDGEHVASSLRYQQGRLTLNGKPMQMGGARRP